MIGLFYTIGLLATGGGLGVELINQHTNKELVCYINELPEENIMELIDVINNGELTEELLAKYGLTNIKTLLIKHILKNVIKMNMIGLYQFIMMIIHLIIKTSIS